MGKNIYPEIRLTRVGGIPLECIQFTDESKDVAFSFVTCNHSPIFTEAGEPCMNVQTLCGEKIAYLGDWIVRGVLGDFYILSEGEFDRWFV